MMPEFNLIQRPDLILRLQSMLGIRQAHVVPSLAETVQPVVIMADVRDTGGERQIVRLAWGGTDIGPVAPNFPRIALLNPEFSRTIITVRSVRVDNPIAATAGDREFMFGLLGPSFNGYGGIDTAGIEFRHSRAIDPTPSTPAGSGPVGRPVAVMTRETNAALVSFPYRVVASGTEQNEAVVDSVLLPGWALAVHMGSGAATAQLKARFVWEEEDLDQRG